MGERLRFSLPVMSECGAPIYPSKSKSVLRYHRRSKAKIAQMDTSLFEEAVGRKASLFSSDDVGEWGSHLPVRVQIGSEISTEIEGKNCSDGYFSV
jgi:hypothetical protein